MQRITALWNRGLFGKVIIGLVGLVVVCCGIGVLVPRQTTAPGAPLAATTTLAQPTSSPQPTVRPTEPPAPTSAPSPTAIVPTATVASPSPLNTLQPTEEPTAPAPTEEPTALPPTETPAAATNSDHNGDGKVTCADFTTQAEAKVALDAGYTKLDNDGDGIPCESLPP